MLHASEDEKSEMLGLYQKRGLSLEHAQKVTEILSQYPDFWTRHMLYEELRLDMNRLLVNPKVADVNGGMNADTNVNDNRNQNEIQSGNAESQQMSGAGSSTSANTNTHTSSQNELADFTVLRHSIGVMFAYLILGIVPLLGLLLGLRQYQAILLFGVTAVREECFSNKFIRVRAVLLFFSDFTSDERKFHVVAKPNHLLPIFPRSAPFSVLAT